MEQTKALNALAPFLALSKSATSPLAACDLITRATSSPQTYIFAELLQTPQIQALSNSPDHSSHLTLLEIFSHGTHNTYTSSQNLPTLNEAQLLKLRQLSLLSLATDPSVLTYTNLQSSLGLSSTRELEDLVISSIYASLINAQLDPYNQRVLISSISPLRDLQPGSIPSMLSTLDEWSNRCISTLADLEKQIAGIKSKAAKRYREEKEWDAQVEKLLDVKDERDKKDLSKTGGTGSTAGSSTGGPSEFLSGLGKRLGGSSGKRAGGDLDGEEMDLDDDDEEISGLPDSKKGGKSSRKRGAGAHGGR